MANKVPAHPHEINIRIQNQFRIRKVDQAMKFVDQSIRFHDSKRRCMKAQVFLNFVTHYFCQYEPSDSCSAKRQRRFVEPPLCNDAAEDHV